MRREENIDMLIKGEKGRVHKTREVTGLWSPPTLKNPNFWSPPPTFPQILVAAPYKSQIFGRHPYKSSLFGRHHLQILIFWSPPPKIVQIVVATA